MKRLLFKTFLVSIVFFGTGFLLLYLVNARSGLIANSGDKLTSSKWNQLVSQLSGENRIDASLNSPWVNYSPSRTKAGYYKDSFGVVHLRGLIKGGSPNTLLFTLPAGYFPASPGVVFSNIGNDGVDNNLVRIDVYNGGNVWLVNGNGSARLALDGISFRTY